jgi:CHAT domain-containing protein
MKINIVILIFVILGVQSAIAQRITSDTISASENYRKGRELYYQMQFDTAQYFFSKSSEIYLKYKLWDKYLYSESERANCINLTYDFERAFDVLKKAMQLTDNKVDKNKPAYAFALYNYGKVFNNMNIPDSALIYHEKALKIREAYYKTENKELADSYYFLNKIYFAFYDFEKAMYYNEKAYKIAKDIFKEDDSFVIDILNDRGLIKLYSMNHREAESIFQKTWLLTRNKLGNESIENIYSISYLGLVYQDLGDNDEGIELQKESLRLSTSNLGEDHYFSGVACQNLADLYYNKREYETALSYGKKAMEILSGVFGEMSIDYASIVGNVGVIYEDMGDFENAHKYLNKALNIYIELNGEEDYNVSRLYQSIGAAYQDAGDFGPAEEYYLKSLDIKKKTIDSTHYSFAMLYSNMAVNDTYLNKFDRAVEYFSKAKSIYELNYGKKNANLAVLYNNIGDTYRRKGEYKKSLGFFQKSIVSNNKIYNDSTSIFELPPSSGFYSWHDYAISLMSKAEIFASFYSELGIEKSQALKYSVSNYILCDSVLSKAKLSACSKEDKILIANQMINVYKGLVDCLMNLANMSKGKAERNSYIENAFLFSEKNKASVLLEALAGSEAQKFAGIPDSLLKIERTLKIDISYYEKLLAEAPPEEEEKLYLSKLFKLNREYDTLITVFEKKYPKYHDLKYTTNNNSVTELQKIIDKKTALISWFLSESSTCVFFISNTSFEAVQVPQSTNFVKQLSSFRTNISNAYMLQQAIAENDNRPVTEYIKDAHEIFNLLFPKKILKAMKGIENIIIVPDGKLSSIPFEALLTDEYTGEWNGWNHPEFFSDLPYLIKDYNVSYSYSANLFYQTSPKKMEKPEFSNLGDWVALAPVFDNDSISGTNLRTRQLIEKNTLTQTNGLNTRAWLRDGSYISPLPGSEEETKDIFELFESNNKKAVLKTHKYANEEYVKSGALKDFRFLHVATHGMVNESKPELSCILLAQDSSSTEDNILFSGEIYNLELNADLTILSACETGLGKIAEGEGVIGLTRALLYAGCKNIIVSLWQVSDESTNQLMVEFYKNYFLIENIGFSHHLSKSKLKLIKEGKYAHPFFWSPFVLIGK